MFLFMLSEVRGFLERVNQRAAECWDAQLRLFLASLCNVPNIKRWDIPRIHIRRGVLLLRSTIVGTDRIQVLNDGC